MVDRREPVMARDAFGRPALWFGDFQVVWMGWRWWFPFVGFQRIPESSPVATAWRWQFFVGPLEVRRWNTR